MLSLRDFQPLQGEGFTFTLDGDVMTAVLVEAAPLGHAAGGGREPFSLVFRSASASVFPQGIYLMRHGKLGEEGMFLVPIARDADGVQYQAIFN